MEKQFNPNERMIHFVTPSQKIIYIQYKLGTKNLLDFIDFLIDKLKFRIGSYQGKQFISNGKEIEFYKNKQKLNEQLEIQDVDQFLQIQTILIKEGEKIDQKLLSQDQQKLHQEMIEKREKVRRYINDQKVEEQFEVFVKTLNGKTIKINCGNQDTVEVLKEKIYLKKRIPIDEQKLTFDREHMEDDKPLSNYQIKSQSTIHLVLKLKSNQFVELFENEFKEVQNCVFNLD